MKLIWLGLADRDLSDAIDYVGARNPAAALELYRTIRQKSGLLPSQPTLGRPGRVDGTRELVVYPYILAYRVRADLDAVVILRLLHGARQWPPDLKDAD